MEQEEIKKFDEIKNRKLWLRSWGKEFYMIPIEYLGIGLLAAQTNWLPGIVILPIKAEYKEIYDE